ncbi:MAG: hypothetical protein EOO38_30295 [Cytophagaceae bacterium]|nr:MAG: hypothetical protein EOO38_30295 [Cytophagaceae bacterium]
MDIIQTGRQQLIGKFGPIARSDPGSSIQMTRNSDIHSCASHLLKHLDVQESFRSKYTPTALTDTTTGLTTIPQWIQQRQGCEDIISQVTRLRA